MVLEMEASTAPQAPRQELLVEVLGGWHQLCWKNMVCNTEVA